MENEIEISSALMTSAGLGSSGHPEVSETTSVSDETGVKETIDRIWRLMRRQIDALELELNDPSQSLAVRESNARSVARLSLAMRDLTRRDGAGVAEATFGSDDPRSCPRDPEEFKLALMLELDRSREKENLILK
jgi:hypothetical protein